jgi:polysaccharide pyruvyl transferase WcaK-like protein
MNLSAALSKLGSDYSASNANAATKKESHLKEGNARQKKVSFFGHFGQGNFGNESTLQACLYHVRRLLPDAEFTCICSGPEAAAKSHNVAVIPASGWVLKPLWLRGNPLSRFLRKIIIGIPGELYRGFKAFCTLRGMDLLIIPGTGLLTDAYGSSPWGPCNLFKWSLMAKLCGCKLVFASVGAGPIYSVLGRYFVKSALSFAEFRSYRDNSTVEYLKSIGFETNNDRVYPDLAFSLPETVIRFLDNKPKRRTVVGLGLMGHPGRYSVATPDHATYVAYLQNLVTFVSWLLAHDYDVRLLIGDNFDRPVVEEFKGLLNERSLRSDDGRIIYEPVSSVEEFLSQLAATDLVVATRFHNALLALILNKPVICITFHHKCVSLMNEIGLSKYCQDFHELEAHRLVEQFCLLERDAVVLRPMIREKVEGFRKVLDEQYSVILQGL